VRGTLGTGGAGVVYRVFDRHLHREVALKLLKRASGRELYRFKREFRTLADIVHPNLVALHELHSTGGDWYFTMELVEGSVHRLGGPGARRAEAGRDIREGSSTMRLAARCQLVDALLALHRSALHRSRCRTW
jgi:serine/threonine protein kinase